MAVQSSGGGGWSLEKLPGLLAAPETTQLQKATKMREAALRVWVHAVRCDAAAIAHLRGVDPGCVGLTPGVELNSNLAMLNAMPWPATCGGASAAPVVRTNPELQ